MNKPAAFSLRIFVADGDPDGLQIVERTNWNGKAVVFPRALYPEVRARDEFQQTGVYLLLGPREGGDGEAIYVGEGDPVKPRLEAHFANKDFWNRAIFFVAPGFLNKAHVQYLEARLVSRALAAKRVKLDNATIPTEPTLSEADRADMGVFLANMLGILPVLGVDAFDQTATAPGPAATPELTCSGRGATAKGRDTPQGFVVLKGSQAVTKEIKSLKDHFPNVSTLRANLAASGVLTVDGPTLKFTQDYVFNSPSLAAAVVMGCPSSGRVDWKDVGGRTLKEIQEAQANSQQTP
ncbi:MAG: GIY-YIG nuclease family protein [Planctomycetes bacterium]|nr:GIY-YIG nuclease family protein [Planctomycetota bacterium]